MWRNEWPFTPYNQNGDYFNTVVWGKYKVRPLTFMARKNYIAINAILSFTEIVVASIYHVLWPITIFANRCVIVMVEGNPVEIFNDGVA